uniref:Uncharacterized protein n=1 Tax=Cannabis sativa TaxID=3483 RepID=A0A803P4U8_CANSA
MARVNAFQQGGKEAGGEPSGNKISLSRVRGMTLCPIRQERGGQFTGCTLLMLQVELHHLEDKGDFRRGGICNGEVVTSSLSTRKLNLELKSGLVGQKLLGHVRAHHRMSSLFNHLVREQNGCQARCALSSMEKPDNPPDRTSSSRATKPDRI